MDFETDQCYIVVAEDIKTIFLWKGNASSTRSRFIGATRIKKIQDQQGREGKKFKIVIIDEGEEPLEFRNIFVAKIQPRHFKKLRKFPLDRKDDEELPYPYIFKPPEPPDDIKDVTQLQVTQTPKDPENPWENPFCKHCGAFLPEGQSICPSCGKNVI